MMDDEAKHIVAIALTLLSVSAMIKLDTENRACCEINWFISLLLQQ